MVKVIYIFIFMKGHLYYPLEFQCLGRAQCIFQTGFEHFHASECHELARPIFENFTLGEMPLVNCCPVIFIHFAF